MNSSPSLRKAPASLLKLWVAFSHKLVWDPTIYAQKVIVVKMVFDLFEP